MSTRRSLDASSTLSGDDLADSDYDIISPSLHASFSSDHDLDSSIADLGHLDIGRTQRASDIVAFEPPPTEEAKERFFTPGLSVADVQEYVGRVLSAREGEGHILNGKNSTGEPRVVRVYIDGKFDGFNITHAHQLRQAKLSFPHVHLLVGVFLDTDLCTCALPHPDRCELLRHCRWVDEIVPSAPWIIDEEFLKEWRVDYVAIDEGASIDPSVEKERLKGYDLVKSLKKSIPTRRTTGLTILLSERPDRSTISRSTSRTQTPVPSRQGTLRGAPSSLKADLSEKQKVAICSPFIEETGSLPVREQEYAKEQEDENVPEPKVDEFGAGVGV